MSRPTDSLARFFAHYGMLIVLVLLGTFFSLITVQEQRPNGAAGARQLAREIKKQFPSGASALIVVRDTRDEAEFARELQSNMAAAGVTVLETVKGEPAQAREVLSRLTGTGQKFDLIAASETTAHWTVLQEAGQAFPLLASLKLLYPRSYRWPNFLKPDNLLNIANQIAVIAIVAIGVTIVIIAAGIDLSVGSLIALSAVVCTLLLRDFAGAENAHAGAMILCGAGAIGVCALTGFLSGATVTLMAIPPFIATLAMMLVASGIAFILARGQSIYQVPDSFIWLGRGSTLGLPNAVLLMLFLYLAAHLLMKRTILGRYLYAVGGNVEAARLSGVPVRKVVLFAYTVSGALAGLGGVIMASQLKSGSPTYGQMYELYVIAAVVVGGTSLTGGEGKVLGTLIGAFIIAVIQNGMNLTGVESYTQKVVLGLVILGAVMLDILKQRGWQWLRRRRALPSRSSTAEVSSHLHTGSVEEGKSAPHSLPEQL